MAECALTSSRHRAARVKQMQPPTNEQELLDYPSDTFDAEFPLFRNPNATDNGKTVATGRFYFPICFNCFRLYFPNFQSSIQHEKANDDHLFWTAEWSL
jgi:hypothetical protein